MLKVKILKIVIVVFERAAYIEQDHVDNIAEKIKELGATPTMLGDVISPILGKFLGKGLSNTGLIKTLKANIYLENKAMKDFQKLIKNLKQSKEYYDNEHKKIVKSQR